MPGKKKKGSKKGKKKGGKSSSEKVVSKDPMAPAYVPPPPITGERLMKLLSTHHVDEKELYGFKVSTRALEKLTPQEIKDLRLVFEVFDAQGNGNMGPVELRRALLTLGFKLSREQTLQAIHDVSVGGNGTIDFNEFLDVIIDQQGESRDIYEEIMHGFKMFDYDKGSRLSMDNLKQACTEAGVRFTKQELQEMMEEADLNGDGFVDKDEFAKIMLQTNLF